MLGENTGQKHALAACNARTAPKIIDKFCIANDVVQLESNIPVVDMKKLKCKHCPIPGCGLKFLVRLANHLKNIL